MNGKRFAQFSITLTLVLLVIVGVYQVAIDPLFQYHSPWFGLEPVFIDERYQDAGTAKNFEFDNVLMGNSYCENFIISDINKKFGGDTAKLTLAGSNPVDWVFLLKILKEREPHPKMIICCIDPYRLVHSTTESKIDLPKYLYDDNIVNDVNYWFNFQIINDFTYEIIKRNNNNEIPDYDDVFLWGNKENKGGREFVLDHYEQPMEAEKTASNEEYSKKATNSIGILQPYFESMPDTEFVFFFPPFSMLFWNSCSLEKTTVAYKSAMKTAVDLLTNYDNVKVFLWTDSEMLEIMSDLDNYYDFLHYKKNINSLLLDRMSQEIGLLNKGNYLEEINCLYNYVESFNYQSLFD